jgi:hypothetical protein
MLQNKVCKFSHLQRNPVFLRSIALTCHDAPMQREDAMQTGLSHLFIPGPTNLPETVRRAMVVPMPDHRAPAFAAFFRPLVSDLRPVFGTRKAQIALIPGSGTGAWEAAIVNTLNPGDKVLMARHGTFSALWVTMAQRLGLDVEVIDVAWGAPVPRVRDRTPPWPLIARRDQGGVRHPQRNRNRRHFGCGRGAAGS